MVTRKGREVPDVFGLFGKTLTHAASPRAFFDAFGVSALTQQSLADRVLGTLATDRLGISAIDRLGISALTHQSLAEKVLGASAIDKLGISALTQQSLAEKVLGASAIDKLGISALSQQSVADKVLGTPAPHGLGVAAMLGKNLVDTAIGGSRFDAFGISKMLAQGGLFASLADAGQSYAWNALAVAHADLGLDDPLGRIVNALDQEDSTLRLTELVRATLEEVQRLSAQSRSAKVRIFDAMAIISFIWTLVTIIGSASDPEWTKLLMKALEQAQSRDDANHEQLKERIERLEELQRADRTRSAHAEDELKKLLLDIQSRLATNVQGKVAVVATRTPLRWSPRNNSKLLGRVAPGTIALVLNKHRKWAYVLLLDAAGQATRGGWVQSSALR